MRLRDSGICYIRCILLILAWLIAPVQRALANDIRIANFFVHPHSGGNGEVEFDLAWNNSWRTISAEPNNWDAAWVFCKIRRNGGDWKHLKLSTTGHTIPSTPQAITTELGLVDPTLPHNANTNAVVGLMMYRANDGGRDFYSE